MGAIPLSGLAGCHRDAHIGAFRCDRVNAVGLGQPRVCSAESVGLAFKHTDPEACAQWQPQPQALAQTRKPLLREPWILDMDLPVKPSYVLGESGAQVHGEAGRLHLSKPKIQKHK